MYTIFYLSLSITLENADGVSLDFKYIRNKILTSFKQKPRIMIVHAKYITNVCWTFPKIRSVKRRKENRLCQKLSVSVKEAKHLYRENIAAVNPLKTIFITLGHYKVFVNSVRKKTQRRTSSPVTKR